MIYTLTFGITAGTFTSVSTDNSVLIATTDPLPDVAWLYRASISGYLSAGGVKVPIRIDFTGENESAVGATIEGSEWANTVVVCSQVLVGPQKPAIRITLVDPLLTFAVVTGGEITGTLSCEATDVTLPAIG